MSQHVRSRLQVEFLEAREVPNGSPTRDLRHTHASHPAGRLGSVEQQRGGDLFNGRGAGHRRLNRLVATAGSRGGGRTWFGSRVSADTGAAISVKADSLVPVSVFARGANLDSNTPTYLTAVVTRGLKVELRQVIDGDMTVLGSVASPGSSYLSGQWVRVSLVPTGNSVAVRVVRADTGQYLNANGTWQAIATDAITATTTLGGANRVRRRRPLSALRRAGEPR